MDRGFIAHTGDTGKKQQCTIIKITVRIGLQHLPVQLMSSHQQTFQLCVGLYMCADVTETKRNNRHTQTACVSVRD